MNIQVEELRTREGEIEVGISFRGEIYHSFLRDVGEVDKLIQSLTKAREVAWPVHKEKSIRFELLLPNYTWEVITPENVTEGWLIDQIAPNTFVKKESISISGSLILADRSNLVGSWIYQ